MTVTNRIVVSRSCTWHKNNNLAIAPDVYSTIHLARETKTRLENTQLEHGYMVTNYLDTYPRIMVTVLVKIFGFKT